jgi:hypothetical protein
MDKQTIIKEVKQTAFFSFLIHWTLTIPRHTGIRDAQTNLLYCQSGFNHITSGT